MSDAENQIHIVFNGEIYNFRELRKDLEQKGHSFKTASDTEAIIYVYKEYGVAGFEKLNGIFAFGIYDERDNTLILARDHFGVKPLYYAFREQTLLFASEIKAILRYPDVHKEFDYEAFNTFLTFRYSPSPQTLLKGIRKLPPGHYLKIDTGGQEEIASFWIARPRIDKSINEEDAIDEYARLLEQSVVRQMVSDVPVGLFLSGGVDSAVIGYLMQKHVGSEIKTFTVGFPGEGTFNELADAKEKRKAYRVSALRNRDYPEGISRFFFQVVLLHGRAYSRNDHTGVILCFEACPTSA